MAFLGHSSAKIYSAQILPQTISSLKVPET